MAAFSPFATFITLIRPIEANQSDQGSTTNIAHKNSQKPRGISVPSYQ
jgi:hypothetical protein